MDSCKPHLKIFKNVNRIFKLYTWISDVQKINQYLFKTMDIPCMKLRIEIH